MNGVEKAIVIGCKESASVGNPGVVRMALVNEEREVIVDIVFRVEQEDKMTGGEEEKRTEKLIPDSRRRNDRLSLSTA